MKPVFQSRFGKGVGNCFQACVASIFEMDLWEVPDFCNIYPNDRWQQEYHAWLNKRGLSVLPISLESVSTDDYRFRDAELIVSGLNADGVGHSTVWCNGKMIHNPNPNPNCSEITPTQVDLIFCLRVSNHKIS